MLENGRMIGKRKYANGCEAWQGRCRRSLDTPQGRQIIANAGMPDQS